MSELNVRMFWAEALKHDVPTDRAHVEQLKRSIKERGQIAPIIVWAQGNAVIDGFHRLTALAELKGEVQVSIVDCSEDAFLDARIISACMHKSVSFARITLWVQELFLTTKWAVTLKASEAFKLGGKRGQFHNLNEFDRRYRSGMSSQDIIDLTHWVQLKAQVWGLSPDQVSNMLHLAEIASPQLTVLVSERKHSRDGALTRPMLTKIASLIPDHKLQEAVANKARAERLNEHETQVLVDKVITAPAQRVSSILTTSWVEQKTQGPQPKKGEEGRVSLAESYAFSLQEKLDLLSEARPTANTDRLNMALTGVLLSIARYRGEGGAISEQLESRLHTLASDNISLRSENDKLRGEIKRMENLLKQGREMYREQTA